MSDRVVHSIEPLNAEPSLARLRASCLTAQTELYVRCHGAIPVIDAAAHRLRVRGQVARPLDLSLEQLRARFATRTVQAAIQCAGNRRSDLLAVGTVSGDPWAAGAIGNAEWTGVALADVLHAAGVAGGARHVAFHARDSVVEGDERFAFAVSIPLGKALAPEVLLAWAINGEALTPRHGAPLRVIVPGYAGVRSAKWVDAVEVRDTPAPGPIQSRDYKLFPARLSEETADPASGMTINEMPLNAAICEPAGHAELAAGKVEVRGYAIAPGRQVARVEVSVNAGLEWHQATLETAANAWSWVFWAIALDIEAGAREIVVRAWDCAGQTQPARPEEVWNFKGYLCNAWHRVPVTVR